VQTSGVSQIPQAEIGRAALIGEAELGATVAQQSEAERLQDKAVEQQKELAAYQDTLSTAAETRRRKWAKSSAAAGLGSQIIGAGIGGVTGYLTKKYLT
jgi:F0F1-type ATP synthase assembly protein I